VADIVSSLHLFNSITFFIESMLHGAESGKAVTFFVNINIVNWRLSEVGYHDMSNFQDVWYVCSGLILLSFSIAELLAMLNIKGDGTLCNPEI
jgi:hypothetical protein